MRATEWLPRSYKNKSFTLVEQNDLFFIAYVVIPKWWWTRQYLWSLSQLKS